MDLYHLSSKCNAIQSPTHNILFRMHFTHKSTVSRRQRKKLIAVGRASVRLEAALKGNTRVFH